MAQSATHLHERPVHARSCTPARARPLVHRHPIPSWQVLPSQHFTEPPPRFSEGSLVRHLEELGIGRPSTYASIMRALQERGYCSMLSKAFVPQQRGQLVTALLTCDRLEQYVQTSFTARLEAQLDSISAGELAHDHFLASWWGEFLPAVEAVKEADTAAIRERVAEKCAWGYLPGCFPLDAPPTPSFLPTCRCAWTLFPSIAVKHEEPPTGAAHVASAADATVIDVTDRSPPDAAEGGVARPDRRCPSCGVGQMSLKFSKFGPFVGCSEYPLCGWTSRPREPGEAEGDGLSVDKLALGPLPSGALSGESC